MIIWILAFVLFACSALAGFTLGVIRAVFSLVGLLLGALLAIPLGHFLNSTLNLVGVKNPLWLAILGPVIVYLLILTGFKLAGFGVNRKVDVYYKYKAGDLRLGLWNRLNPRLGLCVGLANAAVYLILISLVIFIPGYATTQLVTGDNASLSVRLLNLAARQVQSSGMAPVAAAIDPVPETYYQAVDLAGLIYHNDLLEGRLSRYPAFLALGERPEFQDIANDKSYTELRQRQAPIMEILDDPKAQNIVNNPDMLNLIWGTVKPNLGDLETFLKTGRSPKYDGEKILGRWDFDMNGAIALLKRSKPNIASQEMQRTRRTMLAQFGKTTLIAAPDKQVILKNSGKLRPAPKPNTPPSVDLQTFQGQWSGSGNKYQFDLGGHGTMEATVEGDRLTLDGESVPMAFAREY